MNKKKIMWVVLLIIVIIAIVAIIVFTSSNRASNIEITSSVTNNTYNKNTNTINETESKIKENNDNYDKEDNNNVIYQKIELEDGTLYSIDGKKYKADFVVGDNYFDTTITDMYYNSENYMNKNIEIEGMYFENLPYTFVGRYSTSNLCAYCPVGYSFLEYQLKGSLDRKFTEELDWIKVIGTLAKGNDETSNYEDYYYLEVLSLEVMNKRGQATINN